MENNKSEKRFDEWIKLKSQLHFNGKLPRISEGEVWWCSFGENVGVEINGKGSCFTRPVLIMRKLSIFSFMGVPLTSQEKSGAWYTEFEFLGKRQWAALCQSRVMSSSRLYSRMGRVPESDLELIQNGFQKLYFKKKICP